MINLEILQDILTDHKLCPTQRKELEKVIEQERRFKEFMKMYTAFPRDINKLINGKDNL